MVGWLPLFSMPLLQPFSKRSLFNLSYINDVAHYPFINHVLEADGWVTPQGSTYDTVNPSWPELLDLTTGYPNNATASGKAFGGGLKFPDSAKFSGPYVITWDGNGTLSFNGGTWTESNNTGTTYTKNGNGNWSSINGQTAKIIASVTGLSGGFNLVGLYVNATGGADGFVRNVRVYRQADETDLLAGNVFRAGYKAQVLAHNPSCIRVMNWASGNDDEGMRFENRVLPTACSYGTSIDFSSSPLYGTSSGTARFTVPLISTGARQTPASMTSGEIAIFRFGSAFAGGPAYNTTLTVTALTTGATPRVTTNAAHNYTTGMKVLHNMPSGSGVPNLNKFPCTITVINSTQYDITNFNSTGMTYVASSGTSFMYISLNVGARGEYPICFHTGESFPGTYGDDGTGTFLKKNYVMPFYFDKMTNGVSDGAGNMIKGAWIWNQNSGGVQGHWDGVPLEILTKLFVELNATSTKPISMWMCMPHRGMLSIDPDYSSASNFAVKATDIILNGNTVGGVTYPGLKTGAPRANLYIEFCNEIWNFGPTQGYWMQSYANARWGTASSKFDAHMLRATCQARDIKTAFPSEPQIKYIYGGFAAGSMAPGGGFANYYQWHGNSTVGGDGNYYTTDSVVTGGSWGPPKSWFDGFAIAPYFDCPASYYTTTAGTGNFTDDSAMYNGINNSTAASYTASIAPGSTDSTMTVTAISTNSVLNVGDTVTGAGVTGGTTITGFRGATGGVGAYAVSNVQTVASTTMTGPAHGGGNYTGAANQAQALSNFVTKALTDTSDGLAAYAGFQDSFIASMGTNQFVVQYEGGPNWTTLTGQSTSGGHTVTATDTTFLVATYHLAALGTGIANYFDTICAKAHSALPAVYLSVNAGYRWTFASPDSYDTGSTVEGSSLANNPAWTALSTRNASVT